MSGWPREEFLDGDGNPGADPVRPGRSDAECAAKVAAAWLRQTQRVPPQFAVGVALHETSYRLNERDTEQSGKRTGGIFQLTLGGTPVDRFGDATRAKQPDANPFLLDDACSILATLAGDWADKLIDASGLDEATAWVNGLGGYLAWAHNAGLYDRTRDDGSKTMGPLSSVQKYGLDWNGARLRNYGLAYFDDKIGPYGDDCVHGGPDWQPAFATLPSAREEGWIDDTEAQPALIDAATRARLRVGLLAVLLALLVWLLIERKGGI